MSKFAQNDELIEIIINDPIYDIRDDGTIWAYKPKTGPSVLGKTYPIRRVDRLGPDKRYMIVTYRTPGQDIHKIKYIFAHRIIYRKFINKLNPLLEINHKDGNKLNNIPSNLELISDIENIEHAVKNHLVSHSENRPNSKLTSQDVVNIRSLLKQGIGVCELSRRFNINRQIISKIKTNEAWTHVP